MSEAHAKTRKEFIEGTFPFNEKEIIRHSPAYCKRKSADDSTGGVFIITKECGLSALVQPVAHISEDSRMSGFVEYLMKKTCIMFQGFITGGYAVKH